MIGMMPGMMGTVMPSARQSLTNLMKVAASKKSCVTMRSAPASHLAFRFFKSASYVASGWPFG